LGIWDKCWPSIHFCPADKLPNRFCPFGKQNEHIWSKMKLSRTIIALPMFREFLRCNNGYGGGVLYRHILDLVAVRQESHLEAFKA
jgi:hypothetical protein